MCSCRRHWVYRMCLCSDKRVYRVGLCSLGFGVLEQKPSHRLSVCWPSGDNTENDWSLIFIHISRGTSAGLLVWFFPKPVQCKLCPFYRLGSLTWPITVLIANTMLEQIITTLNHILHPNLNLWHWRWTGFGEKNPTWFIDIGKNSHFQNFLQ